MESHNESDEDPERLPGTEATSEIRPFRRISRIEERRKRAERAGYIISEVPGEKASVGDGAMQVQEEEKMGDIFLLQQLLREFQDHKRDQDQKLNNLNKKFRDLRQDLDTSTNDLRKDLQKDLINLEQKFTDLRKEEDWKFAELSGKLNNQEQRMNKFQSNIGSKLEEYWKEWRISYTTLELQTNKMEDKLNTHEAYIYNRFSVVEDEVRQIKIRMKMSVSEKDIRCMEENIKTNLVKDLRAEEDTKMEKCNEKIDKLQHELEQGVKGK